MTNNRNIKIIKIIDNNIPFFNLEQYYNIPIYQRAYAWDENNITELIDDILDMSIDKYCLGIITVCDDDKKKYHVDVIDGQQRLTTLYLILKCLGENLNKELSFSHRDKSQNTLKNIDKIINNLKNNKKIVNGYDEGIINAINCILNKLNNEDIKDEFKEKIKRVFFYQIKISKLNVDDYFEMINTRGEQLEKHDVLKGKLMSYLNNSQDETIFANIWEASSNMDYYIQSSFPKEVRPSIFGSDLDKLPSDEWNCYSVKEMNNRSTSKCIDDIINSNKEDIDKLDIYEFSNKKNIGYKSIITFPYFLFHVLVVYIRIKGIKGDSLSKYILKEDNDVKYTIDDNNISTLFDIIVKEGIKNNDSIDLNYLAKDFILFLLRSRFLFDKYIIKRMTALNDLEDGEWSLHTLKNNGRMNDTFGKKQTKRILMLQSLLRVSYTSPKSMHWITDTLEFLHNNANSIEADEYEELLENYIISRIKKTGFFDNKNINLYLDNVDNSRIIFNYLDYLLWKEGNYSDFNFEFRNSIDHFYPQNPEKIDKYAWKNNIDVNYFGNLSLVSRNLNSNMSNYLPSDRVNRYYKEINKSTLKIRRMAQIIKDNSENVSNIDREWTNTLCIKHGEEMIKILETACRINDGSK